MVSLVTHGCAQNGRPEAEKENEKWVVISVEVSISLAHTENDKEEETLQVEMKASKALETRNDLIETERNQMRILTTPSCFSCHLCHSV